MVLRNEGWHAHARVYPGKRPWSQSEEQGTRVGRLTEYDVASSDVCADASERVMGVNARSPLPAATPFRGRASTQC